MNSVVYYYHSSSITSPFSRIFDIMNSSNTMLTASFALGFMHSCKKNKQRIIDRPLFSLFNASIGGIITSYFANLIGSFMPQNFRFLIPLTILILCYYYNGKNGNDGNDSNNNNKIYNDTYDLEKIYGNDI